MSSFAKLTKIEKIERYNTHIRYSRFKMNVGVERDESLITTTSIAATRSRSGSTLYQLSRKSKYNLR